MIPETIPQPPDSFANPHLACGACGRRVTNIAFPGSVNLPCGHQALCLDLCPSWSPVDDCSCPQPHREPWDGDGDTPTGEADGA